MLGSEVTLLAQEGISMNVSFQFVVSKRGTFHEGVSGREASHLAHEGTTERKATNECVSRKKSLVVDT